MDVSAKRPRVICHMAASIDGRIVSGGWPHSDAVRREYEKVHASYESDGWICGRVTMEPLAGGLRSDAEVAIEHDSGAPRADFLAPGLHQSFAFAVDAGGRLAWRSNDIDGDHVVAILRNGYLTSISGRFASAVCRTFSRASKMSTCASPSRRSAHASAFKP